MIDPIEEIHELLAEIRPQIESRLREFEQTWTNGTDLDLFSELVFCLFTPQSKARSCWAAVERLRGKGILMNGNQHEIAADMSGVRFHHTKAARVVGARHQFFEGGISLKTTIAGFENPAYGREWLVKNVKGLGYKEASHFLRNIGMGRELAILDRHILRNLILLNIIHEIPPSISHSKYLEIERSMRDFCLAHDLRMDHLDILLWYKEAGEVFK